MVDNQWTGDILTIIYSRVKAIALSKLKLLYPKISFTTVPIDTSNATFPTVYIHEISNTETGLSLERHITEGVKIVIQVEVFANDENRVDAKKISYVINDIMKSLMFTGESFPLPEYNLDYTRCVSRYKRDIYGDIL